VWFSLYVLPLQYLQRIDSILDFKKTRQAAARNDKNNEEGPHGGVNNGLDLKATF